MASCRLAVWARRPERGNYGAGFRFRRRLGVSAAQRGPPHEHGVCTDRAAN